MRAEPSDDPRSVPVLRLPVELEKRGPCVDASVTLACTRVVALQPCSPSSRKFDLIFRALLLVSRRAGDEFNGFSRWTRVLLLTFYEAPSEEEDRR